MVVIKGGPRYIGYMNPRLRVRLAWVLLVGSLIGWPISALTVFAHEPQGILGLSWMSLILTAVDILSTNDVRKEQED